MARIAEQEIERLKQEISLERLLESQGIKLKRTGKDLVGTCPFHDDKTPSLIISPDKNLWHCMGACQTGGDVINWTMKSQGVSFRHAVDLLREGDLSSLAAKPVKYSTVTKLDSPVSTHAEDQALLMQVVDYYHETLKRNAEGLVYLEKRGISSEAMEYFKLGFANRSLGYRLPKKNRKEGAAIRGQLQRLGILRSSGHEHFNGSLVIPVINHGQVLEMYGRKLLNNLRKGTPYHLYLPGPHQGVFNLEALQVSKEIILCESLIDALTFWSAGFRNVTTSYGIEGFTNEILEAFKTHGIERVLIAYDRDKPGEKAASSLAAKLLAEGIDCYRIHFPKGMDANEYALQVKPASKSLGTAIRGAVWLGSGKAPEIKTKVSAPVPDEKPALDVAPQTKAKSVQQEGKVESLPASVIPEPPRPEIEAEVKADEVIIPLAARRYRIRGLKNSTTPNQLKVNILVSQDDLLHVDTFDLYAAKARYSFIKQASIELGVTEETIKKDLGKVLLKCESLQEENIEKTLETKDKSKSLDDSERAEALALLKDKNLLGRILDDFNTAGVVGEETNKLVGYLAAVSRKLDKPLAIIIQSTSAAGKSSLMDAVLNMMPEEERVQYSAMTGQSLFYMGETNLKNKILAIAEEEGAENASYALKLLQSEGELTIASTGKDEASGTLITKEYHVEGPVMLFLTTTAIDIDEELMNRCVVLTVNESREQTQAIHAMQRKMQTLEGLLQNEDKKQIIQLHRNAQRLLRPLLVANPFAEQLTFIDDKTRTRRDHMKYLTLIKTVALLHQYQRPVKTIQHNGQTLEYIEVIPSDIETANRLAHDVLGRSLDELPPQTKTLLKHIKAMVTEACKSQGIDQAHYRFSRRDIRNFTGWSDGQLKIHCIRLTDLEYLLVHRGGRGHSIAYELIYDGDLQNRKHLMGLIHTGNLQYDNQKSGQKAQKIAPSQGQVSSKLGPSQGIEIHPQPNADNALVGNGLNFSGEGYIDLKNNGLSCRSGMPHLAAPLHMVEG